MGIKQKAASIGLSATLLASLAVTTVGVGTALAGNTTSGGGSVIPGNTSAAGSISFSEDNTSQPYGQFSNGTFVVTVYDSKGSAANVSFDTSAVPTFTVNSGTGSVGASVSPSALTVTIAGTDTTKLDSFTVGNLKIKVADGAALGAVQLRVTSNGIGLSEALFTTSGTITANTAAGTTSIGVTLDSGAFVGFQPTGQACAGGALKSGQVTIAAKDLSLAETFDASAGTSGGTIVKSGGTGTYHPAGAAVTQSVCAAVFPSFVTVGDAVKVNLIGSAPTWYAGYARNSLKGGPLSWSVPMQNYPDTSTGNFIKVRLGYGDGLISASDATVTLTITTPGVTYSTTSNTANSLVAAIYNSVPWLAGMATTTSTPKLALTSPTVITVTLPGKSKAGDQLWISPEFDVAASVPNGTSVKIAVATSVSTATVDGTPLTIATVGQPLTSGSTVTNITIGQTNQALGVIALTETAAGQFADGKQIGFCLPMGQGVEMAEPVNVWAVVTAGDLKLNVKGSSATQGLMTRDYSSGAALDCYYIYGYTKSTAASTIKFYTGTSSAPGTTGPVVNVSAGTTPGPVHVTVYTTYRSSIGASQVVVANKVWSTTPIASSTLTPVYRGGSGQAVGNIVISEGYPGMFQPGNTISMCIVSDSNAASAPALWSNPTGSRMPVVTTNNSASGLVATYDWAYGNSYCLSVTINTKSLNSIGQITVSNLKMSVASNAPFGPIRVKVGGTVIDETVTPASVNPVVEAAMKPGTNQRTGTFITTRATLRVNSIVTIRAKVNGAAAGTSVRIWRSTDGKTWKSLSYTRVSLNGYAYYNAKISSKGENWFKVQSLGGISNILKVRGR